MKQFRRLVSALVGTSILFSSIVSTETGLSLTMQDLKRIKQEVQIQSGRAYRSAKRYARREQNRRGILTSRILPPPRTNQPIRVASGKKVQRQKGVPSHRLVAIAAERPAPANRGLVGLTGSQVVKRMGQPQFANKSNTRNGYRIPGTDTIMVLRYQSNDPNARVIGTSVEYRPRLRK